MNIFSIPFRRALLYFLVALFIPLFLAYYFHSATIYEIEELKEELWTLSEGAREKERKQKVNLALAQKHKESDRFFIQNVLENPTFLQPEISFLTKVVENPNFAGDPDILERLRFLQKENKLSFSETQATTTPYFREAKFSQNKPVQVDFNDVLFLLKIIEGTEFESKEHPTNMPQLTIVEFKLDRQELIEGNEVYLLQLKLLKREFP